MSELVGVSALAEFAERADAADELAAVRDRFDLDDGVVYLDGNSLGALPRNVPERVADVLTRQWGRLRIRSWSESGWWDAPERVGDRIAPLIGAPRGHVVVGDSTSVNVFRALVAAVRLAVGRREVLVDATTFPTDGYLATSVARLMDVRVRPVHPDALADEIGADTGVVLLNHVDFRSGRRWDLAGLTRVAHQAGALAVWDLSHSAGALPIEVERHEVDFAVGCTYKYLNGGPGAPAYFYVRPSLLPRLDQPLSGWCSHRDPFAMEPEYAAADGITKARGGTPEIVSLLTLDAALDAFDGVDIAAVRRKSLALTEFFFGAVRELTREGQVRVLTPEDEWRGSQVALSCVDAERVMKELIARDVVGDYRPPDVLRFGFAPLYLSFADTLRAARVLAEVLG